MKYLLLILALAALFVVLGFRRARPPEGRSAAPAPAPDPKAPPAEPAVMLSCAQCGLHLPRDEALPGRGGVFCTAAHREAFEAAVDRQ